MFLSPLFLSYPTFCNHSINRYYQFYLQKCVKSHTASSHLHSHSSPGSLHWLPIWSSCFPFAPCQSVPVTPLLSSFPGFHIPEAKPESLSCPCPERLYTSVVAASHPAALLSFQSSHTSLLAVPLTRQALLCHSTAPGLAGTRIPPETCSICCRASFRALPHVSLWRETCSDLTGWNRPHHHHQSLASLSRSTFSPAFTVTYCVIDSSDV